MKEISLQTVQLEKNEQKLITFDLSQEGPIAYGVLRVTAFTEKNTPLAERLIFSEPPLANVQVSINLDKKNGKYTPGDKAKLDIKIKDSENDKLKALVGISVVDESILEMVSKRKQVPRLPVMVFLENEVNPDRLDDAKIFLDRNNPKSKLALDLLLGTQGWRKFAFVDHENFINRSSEIGKFQAGEESRAKNADAAFRLLGITNNTPLPSIQEQLQKLKKS